PLETSRRVVASEIRHAGLCRYAERLDLSNHLSADLSGDGPAAPLHPPVDFDRSLTAAFRLYVHEPAAGAFLLRAVSGGRLERRLFCLCARAQGTLAAAVVVVPAKVLLPAGDVLRNDQVGLDGISRRGRRLGQAGKKSYGGSAALMRSVPGAV